MKTRPVLTVLTSLAAVLILGTTTAVAADEPLAASASSAFVTRSGPDFRLAGKTFRFNGSNNYYLMYQPAVMVDDVIADAAGAGFNMLRTWGWLDIGNADDTNSVHHKENGVYFQYWDGTRPAYNDGADGLTHLDHVLAAARRAGIRLVIPLTNNWSAFGGMDQYVRWRGGQYHDEFYTDPVIRGWYTPGGTYGAVADEAGRVSNVAELRVTVRPRPGDAVVVESFESGPDGWASAPWQTNGGTTESTAEFHPDGALGLRVHAADGGWFGVSGLATPLDLSGKTTLSYDLRTTAVGTSTSIAVQTGAGWDWCQSVFGWVNPGTTTTVEIDLATQMSCDGPALAEIHAIWIFVGGGGDTDLDFVRAV